jgi:hypothetical protein
MLASNSLLHSAKLNRHRSTCGRLARDRVNWIIEVEHQATFSLNALYYLSYRRNFEAFYKSIRWRHWGHGDTVMRLPTSGIPEWKVEKRGDQQEADDGEYEYTTRREEIFLGHDACMPAYAAETDAQKIARLIERLEHGYPTDNPELIKLIPANRSDHAIEILADVRAYWQGKFKHNLVELPRLFNHFFHTST